MQRGFELFFGAVLVAVGAWLLLGFGSYAGIVFLFSGIGVAVIGFN